MFICIFISQKTEPFSASGCENIIFSDESELVGKQQDTYVHGNAVRE